MDTALTRYFFGESIPPSEPMAQPVIAEYLCNDIILVEWSFHQRLYTISSVEIRENFGIIILNIHVLKDSEFSEMRDCLGSELKTLQKDGLGSKTKKVEPTTIKVEEPLWSKGLLGNGTAQALEDTMMVMNGFALL